MDFMVGSLKEFVFNKYKKTLNDSKAVYQIINIGKNLRSKN